MIKDSLKYFLIQVSNALIPLIILPILSRALNKSDFGTYSLFKVFLIFLIPLVSFSISNFILKKFYTLNKNDLGSHIYSSIIFSLLLFLFFLISTFIFKLEISNLLKIEIDYLFYALLSAFSMGILSIYLNIFRAIKKINFYFYFSLLPIILFLFLLFMLMIFNQLLLQYVVISFTSSYLVSLIITSIYFYKLGYININFNFNHILTMLKYSYPLVISSFFALIYTSADRFFINKYLTIEEVGLYSATMQLAMLIIMIGTAIQLTWTPFVFEKLTENYSQNFQKILNYILFLSIFLCFIAIVYYLMFPFFFKIILPSNYISGLEFSKYLIIGVCFQSIYWLINPILLFLEKTTMFIYISGISATFSLTLNFLLANKGLKYIAIIFALTWFLQLLLLSITTWYIIYRKK